ncbi:MAG: DUF1499 domain-containing protein, partial [Pseudomonadota bacterium]
AIPAVIAAVLSLPVIGYAFWRGGMGLQVLALCGALFTIPVAGALVQMKLAADAHPFIHDITTDFRNPPQIVQAANAPRSNPARYMGTDPVPGAGAITVAEAQREAYPDLRPMELEQPIEAIAAAARHSLSIMGLTIIQSGPETSIMPRDDGGPKGGDWRIEAIATSGWFGFTDDFIIRLQPVTDKPGINRVDVRSKSRVGMSDLGANAARIIEFQRLLEDRLATRRNWGQPGNQAATPTDS